ncbi:hypothetical protein J3R30DRAFT_3702914 [Lentinula aciculospora]|uniref:Uncharacterized protein n=1 Tax=Lentinula aciculospora TaxID=153920 RepID=A0A9W9ABG3_9AGAR|nr:hypothetical protein J3R30DRAFT_3702914 [Lentinula aciculospora]
MQLLRRSSPTSTLSGSPPANPILSTSLHSLSNEASRASLRGIFAASNSSTGTRRPVIRTEPSMLTCFDPADRELYDLWAPKNLRHHLLPPQSYCLPLPQSISFLPPDAAYFNSGSTVSAATHPALLNAPLFSMDLAGASISVEIFSY